MTDLTATLAERGARYGKFEDHAVIAQGLKDQMWATEGWSRLAPDQRQALEVIQDKVARILNGDPDYTDNWHDIAGYSRLVEDRLNAETELSCSITASPLCDPFRNELAGPRSAAEQIALEPGWIKWAGGECPVPQGTPVDVRFRGGDNGGGPADIWYWQHLGKGYDIIAYRLSPKQD